jgi:tRNA pseudouridine55 synthase
VTGILLLDKPEGVTSAGVIRALKPRFGRAKVGHLGTLDPFASGLLPLCLGEATKVARYLLAEHKAYDGTIRLGTATDTLDREGTTVEARAVPPLDQSALDAVATRFLGRQRQVPPMFSALKRGGVPLYKLARRGIEVAREARDVEVTRFTLRLVAPDCVDFSVACSKGTYVRVLGADVGQALGTVAHLERLRRTRVGRFAVEEAVSLRALEALPSAAPLPLLAVRAALAEYRSFPVAEAMLTRLRQGRQDVLVALPSPEAGETALVLDERGEVAAVIEAGGGVSWRLVRLLSTG